VLRDIDVEKRRQELVLDVEEYAAKVLTALPQPLAIVDKQLRVLWVNQPFLTTFRVEAHGTVGNLLQNLGSGQWAHPKLRAAIEEALAGGQSFHDFRIEHRFETIGHRVMRVSGSVVTGIAGPESVVLLTILPDGDSQPPLRHEPG
jgi:two-component system, chemotaxis family, CheB/CheR fusion protein